MHRTQKICEKHTKKNTRKKRENPIKNTKKSVKNGKDLEKTLPDVKFTLVTFRSKKKKMLRALRRWLKTKRQLNRSAYLYRRFACRLFAKTNSEDAAGNSPVQEISRIWQIIGLGKQSEWSQRRKFPTKDQLRKETCSALCLCWMNIGRSFGSGSGKNWKSIDILLREWWTTDLFLQKGGGIDLPLFCF